MGRTDVLEEVEVVVVVVVVVAYFSSPRLPCFFVKCVLVF